MRGFMEAVTLSSKFQIVFPKRIRESLKLKAGDKLVLIPKGGSVQVVKIGSIKDAKGMAPGASYEGLREKRDRID